MALLLAACGREDPLSRNIRVTREQVRVVGSGLINGHGDQPGLSIVRPGLLSPVDQSLQRPFGMFAVTLG
ncbi:hypothetical protein ACYZTX_00255 [Pseudomonas sp. MDT1-17]